MKRKEEENERKNVEEKGIENGVIFMKQERSQVTKRNGKPEEGKSRYLFQKGKQLCININKRLIIVYMLAPPAVVK